MNPVLVIAPSQRVYLNWIHGHALTPASARRLCSPGQLIGANGARICIAFADEDLPECCSRALGMAERMVAAGGAKLRLGELLPPPLEWAGKRRIEEEAGDAAAQIDELRGFMAAAGCDMCGSMRELGPDHTCLDADACVADLDA